MDIPLTDRRSKTVVRALAKFVDFMNKFGHEVKHIQTDRGTEFFGYQDGETKEEDLSQYDKETLLGQFTSACDEMDITHTVKSSQVVTLHTNTKWSPLFSSFSRVVLRRRHHALPTPPW